MRRIMIALLLAGSLHAQYLFTGTATVAAAQITGTLVNFPALISTTQTDWKTVANGGKIQNTCTQTVGNRSLTVPCDLVFASDSACTSKYSWEIETYNATTGQILVWVKVGSIAVGTVVHICYDNAAVNTLQTTPTSTWSANYVAVYHMPEDPSGTSPQLNDSTTNANHGTTVGSMTSGEQVAGQVDGSISWNGSSQYATLANPSNFAFERTNSFSGSCWYKVNANASSYGMIGKQIQGGASTGWEFFLRIGTSNPTVGLQLANNANTNGLNTHTTTEFSQSAWHFAAFTYDGSSSTSGALLYVDGSSQSKTDVANTLSASILTSTGPEMAARDTTPGIPFNGSLDECRVYAIGVVLTSAWIGAEYNNQFAPNTFFSLVVGSPIVPIPVGQGARIY